MLHIKGRILRQILYKDGRISHKYQINVVQIWTNIAQITHKYVKYQINIAQTFQISNKYFTNMAEYQTNIAQI